MIRRTLRFGSFMLFVFGIILLLSSTLPTSAAQTEQVGIFSETFDGSPAGPQPFSSPQWDIAVHKRAPVEQWDMPMQAAHDATCAAPPSTHTVQTFDESVYQCRDHIMTALYAEDYGVIYLTPNQMVDFSQGTATVRFDMSTLRTSGRDWVDLWITPYSLNMALPLDMDSQVDLSGPPAFAVQIKMNLGDNAFTANVFRNFQEETIKGELTPYDSFLKPDPARRDTFELQISRNRIKFGMPQYNFWWIDKQIAPLIWTTGVVQLGHHSYNPLKDCTGCSPNVWHWDNVQISPSRPFTIVPVSPRAVGPGDAPMQLQQPAPAGASLRFSGIGKKLEVSFNGGKSWVAALQQQQSEEYLVEEHFRSYWMPIPEGTTQVLFRGQSWFGGEWRVRTVSVWAGGPTDILPASYTNRVALPIARR